ncbi:MAG: alpha/beta hydrolase [Cyanobacteria bacterium]|nr:alpha/beta hydrolase [Cyanobacteriota bacterium]
MSPRPLLVFLHGWLLSGRLWQPLLDELEPHWDCWAPDLPGFGARPRPRQLQPTLAAYGRWLAEQAQARAAGRPLALIGHSLGGSVALHGTAALGDQLVGLVQIAAGGGVYQPKAFARVRQAGAAFLSLRPSALADLPALGAIRSPLVAELRAARGLLACSTNQGAVRQLPVLTAGLQVPSLWLVGSADRVMEPRYVRHLAGYAPNHDVEVLPGLGHLPMRQDPALVADRISAWLLSLPGSRGWAPAGPTAS